ncbi:uracil-DNA glycosylase [Phaeovibrio sulfidiphilus]|uniref:Type-4 uracil-DNA glycosylase n=2 Tax=Phaeovibrio sulfidiphilus TaxID=1220600 RepID=A0A8J6YNJ5_9PROT|nr:uracil-DNA glycosylase [Phaeovibrio sulfidiphilus]
MPVLSPADAVALLHWYREAGVDVLVEDTPQDSFLLSERHAAERAAPSRSSPASSPVSGLAGGPRAGAPSRREPVPGRSAPARAAGAPAVPPLPGSGADPLADVCRSARELAGAARTLPDLQAALDSFSACPLRRTATNTVFGVGNPQSGIMIVGEAPGADEDRQGIPFVGVSGKLLDAMLASIGLDRSSAYISNVIPWRPPGNRRPTADEIALCLPFLSRHLDLVRPRLVLALGGLAAQTLLSRTEGITRLRGRWGDLAVQGESAGTPVLATFHPAYLLRTPEHKRLAWRDLLEFRARMRHLEAPGP